MQFLHRRRNWLKSSTVKLLYSAIRIKSHYRIFLIDFFTFYIIEFCRYYWRRNKLMQMFKCSINFGKWVLFVKAYLLLKQAHEPEYFLLFVWHSDNLYSNRQSCRIHCYTFELLCNGILNGTLIHLLLFLYGGNWHCSNTHV